MSTPAPVQRWELPQLAPAKSNAEEYPDGADLNGDDGEAS